MKKISVSTLAVATALMLAPLAAQADQTPGFYVGGGIGADQTMDAASHTKPHNSELFFDPGYSLNASGGYSWNNGLRVEGELWHSRADLDAVHGAQSSNGHLSNNDFFGNAYYDFHTGTMLTPYVGAGVGIALVNFDHVGTLTNGADLNGYNAALAYQGIAGAALQLDYNWAVTADYRYVATTNPKVHTSTGAGAYTDNASNNIVVGVRYSFGQPAAEPVYAATPPAKPMVRAAAKPAVAPIPQSYMVFFDFNKSALTPEAKRILASAAQDFQKGGFVKIVVTGHTDTVGTMKYNQKLSEARAEAVKAELEKLGVSAQVVKAVGAGKNGLLVPTADGVREAQNRRAEIVFDKQ